MTRKQAGVISAIAFVALLRPVGNLVSIADFVWWKASGGSLPPRFQLYWALFDAYGIDAQHWIYFLFNMFAWVAAAISALLIFRFLRRRDFTRLCADCAAHRVWAWMLFLVFSALSFMRPSLVDIPIPYESEEESLPLEGAMAQNPTLTLELCLCHPDSDRLERELKAQGRLTDEVLRAAPQLDGYRLMRVKGDDDAAKYVSEVVELSLEDFMSARASESLVQKGFYNITVKLTPEGRGKLARLTRDYCPCGRLNPSDHGRMLAIVVNGELVSTPIIQMEIDTAEFAISGKFAKEKAIALAAALNSRCGGED